MAQVLESYENSEYGIVAIIAQNAKGFFVTVKDLDADEYVGFGTTYPTIERAREAAIKAAD